MAKKKSKKEKKSTKKTTKKASKRKVATSFSVKRCPNCGSVLVPGTSCINCSA